MTKMGVAKTALMLIGVGLLATWAGYAWGMREQPQYETAVEDAMAMRRAAERRAENFEQSAVEWRKMARRYRREAISARFRIAAPPISHPADGRYVDTICWVDLYHEPPVVIVGSASVDLDRRTYEVSRDAQVLLRIGDDQVRRNSTELLRNFGGSVLPDQEPPPGQPRFAFEIQDGRVIAIEQLPTG